MKLEIGLSRRAYARHCSVDDKAVPKAISTGRIAAQSARRDHRCYLDRYPVGDQHGRRPKRARERGLPPRP